nr:MAG TPA: hypothetical protein [Caudoviricetes sp.]
MLLNLLFSYFLLFYNTIILGFFRQFSIFRYSNVMRQLLRSTS